MNEIVSKWQEEKAQQSETTRGHKVNFDLIDLYDRIIKIAALIIAAYLAHLKFLKGRLYKIRIAPELSCNLILGDVTNQLCVSMRITNVGSFAASIPKEGFFLEMSEAVVNDLTFVKEVKWKPVNAFHVFVGQTVIEIAEVAHDELVISIPKEKFKVVRLRFKVWTHPDKHHLVTKYRYLERLHDRWNFTHDFGSNIEVFTIVPMVEINENK